MPLSARLPHNDPASTVAQTMETEKDAPLNRASIVEVEMLIIMPSPPQQRECMLTSSEDQSSSLGEYVIGMTLVPVDR